MHNSPLPSTKNHFCIVLPFQLLFSPMNNHRWLPILILQICLLFPSTLWGKNNCDVLTQSGNSTLYQCEKLTVALLKGNASERYESLGNFYRSKHINPTVIHYFSNYLERLGKKHSSLAAWLMGKIHNMIARIFQWNTPKDWMEIPVTGLSKTYGLNTMALRRAILLPDLLIFLNTFLNKSSIGRILPTLGCTSIVHHDKKNLFYGRNLDFTGVGTWDQHPMLTIHLSDQKTLSYASFGAHGMPYGGITGINEAGVFIDLHQSYGDEYSIGLPVLLIGDQLLQKAKNTEEAIAFLKKYRPGSMWTFVVGSLKENTTYAVETSKSHFYVRKETGPSFVQTNHLAGPKLQQHQWMDPAGLHNSKSRYTYVLNQLEKNKSNFNIRKLIELLSYQSNPTGEMSQLNDIVKPNTIQTILLHQSPNKDTNIYLSMDPAPTSSGRFLKLSFSDIFQQARSPNFKGFSYTVISQKSPRTLAQRKNQKDSSLAQEIYTDDKEYIKAATTINQQSTPSAQLFKAVAHYKGKKYEKSLEISQAAIASKQKIPPFIYDGLMRVNILSLVNLKNTEAAKNLAVQLSKEKIKNYELKEIIQDIINGEEPSHQYLRFSFSTGTIKSKAQNAW